MNRFKIGDEVKVICGCGCTPDGKVATIVDIHEDEYPEVYAIKIPGNSRTFNCYEAEDLELIKQNRNGANT